MKFSEYCQKAGFRRMELKESERLFESFVKRLDPEDAKIVSKRKLSSEGMNSSGYRKYYDIIAPMYDVRHAPAYDDFEAISLVLMDEVKGMGRVLDIAHGTGLITCYLAAENPSTEFYGIDSSPRMVSLANKRMESLGLRNVTFQQGMLENIPFPDQYFDLTYATRINPSHTHKEELRVVKDGGRYLDLGYPLPEDRRNAKMWGDTKIAKMKLESGNVYEVAVRTNKRNSATFDETLNLSQFDRPRSPAS